MGGRQLLKATVDFTGALMNIESTLRLECLQTLVRARENSHEVEYGQEGVKDEVMHIRPAVRPDSSKSANL